MTQLFSTGSRYRTVLQRLMLVCAVFFLVACSVAGHVPNSGPLSFAKRKDSAPLLSLDPRYIRDAVPRSDPVTMAGNKSPYTVLGQTYRVLAKADGYREEGIGSWYGTKFHGRKTSNGERYSLYGMTAAHKTLPIPCYVKVTNLENNRTAIVRVNDRGPFHDDRIIDLSYAAASKLGYAGKGTARLRVEVVTADNPSGSTALATRTTATGSPSSSGAARVASAGGTAGQSVATHVPSIHEIPKAKATAVERYLQAGAFSEYDTAQALQQRLQKILLKPVAVLSTENLYKVHVGPLAMNEVEKVRQLIISADLGNPHVVMRP